MAAGPTPDMIRIRELIANDPTGGQSSTGGWEQAWQQKVTPWDAGDVQPAFRELLDERWKDVGVSLDSLKDGKALVAGCGRGCDAAFIAQHGLETIGIDLSQTAVEVARAHLAKTPDAPSNITFQVGDFFKFDPPAGGFALAFDYTFFCAINPSMRPQWGQRYGEVIRPNGLLICLAFPIDGNREGGPPFSVSEGAYDAALGADFDKIYSEQPTKLAEGRAPGRDRLLVYKRKEQQ